MTLTHCPRCDYSLEGLPEVHPCPECGLVCDRGAEVFLLQSPKLFGWNSHRTWFAITWVLFVLLLILGWLRGVLHTQIELFIPVGCGAVWLFRVARRIRRSRFAVVLPHDVCLYTLAGGRQVIKIAELDSASHGGHFLGVDGVSLAPRDGRGADWYVTQPLRFRSLDAAAQFTTLVRERITERGEADANAKGAGE